MADTRLDQLRTRVLDEDSSLAGLLRMCLVLGAETDSSQLREWAGLELRGYGDDNDVPEYRKIPASLFADSVSGNYWATGQMLSRLQIPAKYRNMVPEAIELKQPIEELETMAADAEGSINLTSGGLPALAALWSQELSMFQNIHSLYFKISSSTLAGIVGTVRTTLVELVADMAKEVPMTELPSKKAVDQAVQVHVYGSRDTYSVKVNKNTGVIGQGKNSSQSQINLSGDLKNLIDKMRSEVAELEPGGDREDLEQAVDDFEAAISAEAPDEAVIRKRSGALKRLASRTGNAVLAAAASEAGQLAIQGIASLAN